MKIIKKNLKKGEITFKTENLDDLWYLSQIVEPGNLIRGKTERKIKIGGEEQRNAKVVRKTIFLKLEIEKIEFHKYSDMLRVSGTTMEGPEDVPKGSYHTFNVETNTVITIEKKEWLKFQLEKIDEAVSTKQNNILLVVFDREEAFLALLKQQGYELLSQIKGEVQKKEENHQAKGGFYKEVVKKMVELDQNKKFDNIIVASPGFWKEYLLKECPEELKKKITQATVSAVGEQAINEVIKRPELQKVLEQDRISKETKLVDELLTNISKDSACYGMKETNEKINSGAVKELLVTYSHIQKTREEQKYKELENLMKLCENMDGTIHIISSEEASKKLDSLSGIAGILRWTA
jgi:protein pelota